MSVILWKTKAECSGCWACANICPREAISMVPDEEGFHFPAIDDKRCIECGLCLKVCPLKNAEAALQKERQRKHVGIINLQYTNNYGAIIAAAALEETVRELVGDSIVVNTVDYRPFRDFNNRILQYQDDIKIWGGLKLYLKHRLVQKENNEDIRERNRRFMVFSDTFLNITPCYRDAAEIHRDINYVAFITGSDVVWAPRRSDNFRADGYFLKFADKGERRIAYAASIDRKADAKLRKLRKTYQQNISGLDAVSVREKSSVEFIGALTDKKVYQCVDPAVLVSPAFYDRLSALTKVQEKQKYIYVYILEFNHTIVEFANLLAKQTGLKICYCAANHNDFADGAENCISDGPSDFLYHIRNADYVLTNSYHCAVFSLLFERPFLSFERSRTSIKNRELLEQLGLRDRLVKNASVTDIQKKIDWLPVRKKLEEMRISSERFLREALENL